jgi:hypothetical protein
MPPRSMTKPARNGRHSRSRPVSRIASGAASLAGLCPGEQLRIPAAVANPTRVATSFLRLPRIFSELAKVRCASLPDAMLSRRAGTGRAITIPRPGRRKGPAQSLSSVSLARPEMLQKTDRTPSHKGLEPSSVTQSKREWCLRDGVYVTSYLTNFSSKTAVSADVT